MSAEKDSSIREIYVRLLDEGTDVWRPCMARAISTDEYIIVEDQTCPYSWDTLEFCAGTRVRVVDRTFSSGAILPVAVAAVK